MNRDLFTAITEARGEKCHIVARRLSVSTTTVHYVWDHEAELRAAFNPPLPARLRVVRTVDEHDVEV